MQNAPQWLGGTPLTLPSIAIMEVWWGLGYHTIFFLAGLAAIPKDLPEAARIDGANEWQVFWHVTRPQLAPIMMILVVLRFGTAMAVIDEYLIFGGFNRASPTYTWTIFMYDQAFKLGLWRQGYAAAIGMIGAVAMMCVMVSVCCASSVPRVEQRCRSKPILTPRSTRSETRGASGRSRELRHRPRGDQLLQSDHPAAAGLGAAHVGEVAARRDARRFLAQTLRLHPLYAYVFQRIATLPINLFNSVYVTAATVLITTVCAVLAGYALVHVRPRGAGVVVAALLISLYFPVRVVSIISIYETQHCARPDQQHRRPHPALCHAAARRSAS